MKYAFIQNELVLWVVESDNIAASYGQGVLDKLVECHALVEAGWHYIAGEFTPPTAEEIAAEEAAKERAELRDAVSDRLDKLIDVLEGKDILTAEEVTEIMAAGRE